MNDQPKCKRRWYRFTPDRFIVGLLAVEGFLLLSARFRWFAFNEKKGFTVLIALVAVCMFIASSALAHPPLKVNVNSDGTGYACGSVVAAQESGGSVDWWTIDSDVFCRIIDAGGEQASCTTSDPELVAAVRGLPDDTCLFMAFNAEGECTDVITQRGSHTHAE